MRRSAQLVNQAGHNRPLHTTNRLYWFWMLYGAWVVMALTGAVPAAAQGDGDPLTIAEQAIHAGEPERAVAVLERAIKLWPDDRRLPRALAAALAQQARTALEYERPSLAIPCLVRALEFDDALPFRELLAVAYQRDRDHLAAIVQLRKIVAQAPQRAASWKALGFSYYLTDRLEEAQRCWQQTLTLGHDTVTQAWLDRLTRELPIEQGLQRFEALGFRILAPTATSSRIPLLAQELATALAAVSDRFHYWPRPPITVVIYPASQFNSATHAKPWSSGYFDGKVRLPWPVVDGDSAERQRILHHELAHLVIAEVTRRCPIWLHEGLAQACEPDLQQVTQTRLHHVIRTSQLLSLEQLDAGFEQLRPSEVAMAYAQAWSFVTWLEQRAGQSGIRKLLRSLAAAKTVTEACLSVYGEPLDVLEAAWRRKAQQSR